MDMNGDIFDTGDDVAVLMPILEMSRHHLFYLK
jgi:hypothetical protein